MYQGSRDRILGVLYVKDLIALEFELDNGTANIRDLLHPGYFVPRTVTCQQLFREFRRRMTHIALVVSEYGKVVGLATMEDILEEVFGDIRDEKEVPHRTGEYATVDPEPLDDARPSPLEEDDA